MSNAERWRVRRPLLGWWWRRLALGQRAPHDIGDQVGAAAHIRGSLAADGTFLPVEPMAGERLEDKVGVVGRMFYCCAPIVCRPHARSEGGRYELGNQVPDSRCRELLAEAGFRRFRRATEAPFNRIFEVRS